MTDGCYVTLKNGTNLRITGTKKLNPGCGLLDPL